MNFVILKQMVILSLLLGDAIGVLTLIPFVDVIAFLFLMFFSAPLLMWFLMSVEILNVTSNRQSVVAGALVGFWVFIGFCIIYLPLVTLLGRGFGLYNRYGISLFLGAGSFWVIVLLILFMAILSAITNAFGGFVTYYAIDFMKSVEKK